MSMTPKDNEVRNTFLFWIGVVAILAVVIAVASFCGGCAYGQDIWPQKRVETVNIEPKIVQPTAKPEPTSLRGTIKDKANRPKFHTLGWEAKARLAGELGMPVIYWCDLTPFDTPDHDEFFASFPEAMHLLVPKESHPIGRGKGSRVIFRGRDGWDYFILESQIDADTAARARDKWESEPAPVASAIAATGAWSQGFARPQPAFRQEPMRQAPVYRPMPAQQVVRRGGG